MRKLIMVMLLTPFVANAATITGSLSVFGTDTYTASSVSFVGNGSIGTGTATGDYTPTFDPGCFGCLTMTGFNYASFTSPVTLYTGTVGEQTASFTITGIDNYDLEPRTLTVNGTGRASLTGFDDTAATFSLSTQGGVGHLTTFSASENSIPEPSSLLLLGAGLAFVGWKSRRTR